MIKIVVAYEFLSDLHFFLLIVNKKVRNACTSLFLDAIDAEKEQKLAAAIQPLFITTTRHPSCFLYSDCLAVFTFSNHSNFLLSAHRKYNFLLLLLGK